MMNHNLSRYLTSLALLMAITPAAAQQAGGLVGSTATLLADGRILVIGGQEEGAASGRITLSDPRTGQETTLPVKLLTARAWHVAKLLPDGTVLIAGGIEAGGAVTGSAEVLDPPSLTLRPISTQFPERAKHGATVLTDGRVLLTGGVGSDGTERQDADLWDYRAQTLVRVNGPLLRPRANHTARLLSNGNVLVQQTTGTSNLPGEIFDPRTGYFAPAVSAAPVLREANLEGSVPEHSAVDVSVDAIVGLRFSRPLRRETVRASTVILTDESGGAVAAQVTLVEDGMLAFLLPAEPLKKSTTYHVTVEGPTDQSGTPVGYGLVRFTTKAADATPDPEEWFPQPGNNWVSGRGPSPHERQPRLAGPAGATAVSGVVLTLNGAPLAGVTLRIDPVAVRTDASGRFLLLNVGSGRRVLIIDGRSASTPGRAFGFFEYGFEVKPGITNTIPFTIWMPRLDTANAVKVNLPSKSPLVITSPRIPGLELHIPPNSTIADPDGRAITEISLTPVPLDRPPFPIPPRAQIYFTAQPGGAYVKNLTVTGGAYQGGARLIYPNYTKAQPGSRMEFVHYDPDEKGWYLYGFGSVNRDGTQVVPDPGVSFFEFTGAMFYTPRDPPIPFNTSGKGPIAGGCPDGDPVDCNTGIFMHTEVDLYVSDTIPITITRSYQSAEWGNRGFGAGTALNYNIVLTHDDATSNVLDYADMTLHLPGGARLPFPRVTAGTGEAGAEFVHTGSPTVFHKAVLKKDLNGQWAITMRDGMNYRFARIKPTDLKPYFLLDRIQDPNGNTLAITRLSNTDITRITSPNGKYVDFYYDNANRIVRVTDDSGRPVVYEYLNQDLIRVTSPSGEFSEYTYQTVNNVDLMTTVKTPRGNLMVTNEYDPATGRVLRQTFPDAGSGVATYQFAYTLGKKTPDIVQTDVTDPRGTVRRYVFNTTQYATSMTVIAGPSQQQTQSIRQAGSNFVTQTTDPLSRKTVYGYDACRNRTTVTRASGTPLAATTTFTYQTGTGTYPCIATFNRITSIKDPLNYITTLGYDIKGNLNSVIGPANLPSEATIITYDPAGNPLTQTDPTNRTVTLGWQGGQLVSTTDPLNRITQQVVDSAGRVTSVTNPLGFTTIFDFDTVNRLKRVLDPLQAATSFTYDANSNLKTLTDARGGVTGYDYDIRDRLFTRTDPLTRSDSSLYDLNGNLTRVTDRKGQVTTLAYDGFDRVTTATHQDGSTLIYTYDNANRVKDITDSVTGKITLTFDDLDRLTSEAGPQGTVTYGYDLASRRTSMTASGQTPVTYTYDNANRLKQVTQGTAIVAINYDAAGRRTSTTLPNGVAMSYGYDPAGQLTSIDYKQGTTLLGDMVYGYDGAGNRVSAGGSFARTGMPAAVGSAVYDAANRLTQWGAGGPAITHDFNGNMTSDGVKSYAWDARDRLASMTGASGFSYDAMGRRVGKTVGGASTGYLHDGMNVVKTTGAGAADLLTGLGVDEVYTRTDASGARNFLTDALGSTLGLADAAGTVQTAYSYQAYGGTAVAGQANGNPFQFTGRESDGATGLYYYRARYYHPGLGRFISEDPASANGGYGYAGQSPAQFVDPNGEHPVLWAIAEAAGGGAAMGAATDLLIQLIFGDPCKGIDGTRVAVSAGVGAVGGGLGGAAKWFWRARNAAGASAAAAQSIVQAGDHIALGLEAYGLEQTAASVGARHLLKDAAWRTTLQSAIGNPSTRFTIAIDGFAGSSSYGQLMGAAGSLRLLGPRNGRSVSYTKLEDLVKLQSCRVAGSS